MRLRSFHLFFLQANCKHMGNAVQKIRTGERTNARQSMQHAHKHAHIDADAHTSMQVGGFRLVGRIFLVANGMKDGLRLIFDT